MNPEYWDPITFDHALRMVSGMDGDLARFASSTEQHMEIIRRYWNGKGSVLDYGCGIGRLTRRLAETADHVVAVDISARMLSFAGEVAQAANIQWEIIKGLPLLHADQSFNFGLCFLVLEHLDKAEAWAVVREIRRLCKSYLLELSAFGPPHQTIQKPKQGYPPGNLSWSHSEIPDEWGQVDFWDDGGYNRWLIHKQPESLPIPKARRTRKA